MIYNMIVDLAILYYVLLASGRRRRWDTAGLGSGRP